MDFVTGTIIDTFPVSVKLIIVALILVVVLALLVWIMRWLFNKLGKANSAINPSRLAVVDAANIDGHRRMVLIRRDNVEHLVMIGGASDVLIESNIGQNIHSPLAYQQTTPEELSIAEDFAPDTAIQASAFDDIFSPTDTAELTKDTAVQPKAKKSWRDKAGTSAVLASAGLAADRSDRDQANSKLSARDEQSATPVDSNQVDEAAFSGLTNVLDAEFANNFDNSEAIQDATPPSLSSPDASDVVDNSQSSQSAANSQTSGLPDKKDMEDEMQRLLNELTGEKT